MSNKKIKFAKLFETETGQILITRLVFANGYVLAIQFNKDDDGIHTFQMFFDDENNSGEVESLKMFNDLNETTVELLIAKVLTNVSKGITEGRMKDINDILETKH